MAAVANNPAFAKKAGIPQSVGSDFIKADKGHKFAKGGDTMATTASKLFKGKETYKEELAEGKAIKSGKISPQQYARGEGMEKNMKTKKMAVGGLATAHKKADGIAQRGKTKGKNVTMMKGGKC